MASLYNVSISSAEDKAGDSIFEYKKELSITDQQEKNLRGILTNLQDSIAEKKKALGLLKSELDKMLSDKADLGKIKAKLQDIAKIQTDATYDNIVSVRAIEKELTPDQMSGWRAIQENFKKSQQAQQPAPQQKGAAQ